MRLHENTTLYRQSIQFTADQLKMPAVYVEKDYWVTYALFIIFHNEIGKDTIFKGGTSLSKCYNLIERFSEDIDLVVLRHNGESDSKLKSKLKKISSTIESVLPEVEIEGITHKMGMNRKTAHSYSQTFKGDYGQVRDVVVLESTWLGYYEPYTTKSVNSFVGQMMLNNKQSAIAAEYGVLPFDVLTLEPVRTICEKIMSLVRFSYAENPIDDLKRKIRHTYDLHQLLLQKEFLDFFYSPRFDKMLLKVANDDMVSYRNNNKWLVYHPIASLFFKDLEKVWTELTPVYNGDFKNLVYGKLPKEMAVFETLKMIRDRMEYVTWVINEKEFS